MDSSWIIHPKSCINVEERLSNTFPRMVDIVNDVFEHFNDEIESQVNMGGNTYLCSHEAPNEEFVKSQDYSTENIWYKKLMEDAIKPLYPSCQIEYTKLSGLKATFQWSNQSFTALLKLVKNVLPLKNTLPDTIYNAKKMIKSLHMDYKIIHECRNDCKLY